MLHFHFILQPCSAAASVRWSVWLGSGRKDSRGNHFESAQFLLDLGRLGQWTPQNRHLLDQTRVIETPIVHSVQFDCAGSDFEKRGHVLRSLHKLQKVEFIDYL